MMSIPGLALFVLLMWSLQGSASPPLDLTDPDALKKYGKTAPIKTPPRVPDLNYTDDHTGFEVKVPEKSSSAIFDLPARSLPNRDGRILFQLQKGDALKILKDSKDGRWAMVQNYDRQPLRGWIPKSAIQAANEEDSAPKEQGAENEGDPDADFFE